MDFRGLKIIIIISDLFSAEESFGTSSCLFLTYKTNYENVLFHWSLMTFKCACHLHNDGIEYCSYELYDLGINTEQEGAKERALGNTTCQMGLVRCLGTSLGQ